MTQPNQLTYPFAPSLNLFPVDTAGTPGAFDDPTQPRQRWHDPAAAGVPPMQELTYKVWDQNTGKEVSFLRTAEQASAPNIPGVYPAYVVTPTPATYTLDAFIGMGPYPLSPTDLILPADANRLAAELGGTVADATPVGTTVTYGTEKRQWLQINVPGVLLAIRAELLMVNRSQWGMWAPVTIGKDLNGMPSFTQTKESGLPDVQVPQRDLLSNEEVVSVDVVGINYFQIQRTDMTPPTPVGVDGFTPADRTIIGNVDSKLNAIVQLITQALAKA